jgi:hypothetical protein
MVFAVVYLAMLNSKKYATASKHCIVRVSLVIVKKHWLSFALLVCLAL